ncbi:unnamed protein product, partial [Pleuronectes platessa]
DLEPAEGLTAHCGAVLARWAAAFCYFNVGCVNGLKRSGEAMHTLVAFKYDHLKSVSWPNGGGRLPGLLSACSPKTPGSTETGNGGWPTNPPNNPHPSASKCL